MAKKSETQKNIYKGEGAEVEGVGATPRPLPPLCTGPGRRYLHQGRFYRGREHRAGDAPGEDGPGLLRGRALGREGTWGTPEGAPKKTQASEGGSRYPGSDPEGIPGVPGVMQGGPGHPRSDHGVPRGSQAFWGWFKREFQVFWW